MTGRELVSVLERDPDLAGGLGGAELARARRQSSAAILRLPRGPWAPIASGAALQDALGLLVLEGVIVRRVIADATKASAELIGAGDLIQPWREAREESSLSLDVEWEVIEPVRIAVLDRDFSRRVAPWPEVATAISGRIMGRAHWLAFHLAVCQLRRIDDRVLVVLWRLADRWGRVTPRGVELTIALPHSLLASLVGARRPAVSLALQGLTEAGLVQRRSRSRWTLCGAPPVFGRAAPTAHGVAATVIDPASGERLVAVDGAGRAPQRLIDLDRAPAPAVARRLAS